MNIYISIRLDGKAVYQTKSQHVFNSVLEVKTWFEERLIPASDQTLREMVNDIGEVWDLGEVWDDGMETPQYTVGNYTVDFDFLEDEDEYEDEEEE